MLHTPETGGAAVEKTFSHLVADYPEALVRIASLRADKKQHLVFGWIELYPGRGQPGAGALRDQFPLKLCQRRKNPEYQLAAGAGGVNRGAVSGQYAVPDATFKLATGLSR